MLENENGEEARSYLSYRSFLRSPIPTVCTKKIHSACVHAYKYRLLLFKRTFYYLNAL